MYKGCGFNCHAGTFLDFFCLLCGSRFMLSKFDCNTLGWKLAPSFIMYVYFFIFYVIMSNTDLWYFPITLHLLQGNRSSEEEKEENGWISFTANSSPNLFSILIFCWGQWLRATHLFFCFCFFFFSRTHKLLKLLFISPENFKTDGKPENHEGKMLLHISKLLKLFFNPFSNLQN